jgi:glycosyltransferase involved in cell wall biosynthesis
MTALTYNLEKLPIVIHNGRCNYSIEQSYTGDLFAFTAGRLWDEGKNLAAIDRAAAHLSFPVLAAGPLQGPNGVHVRSQHLNVLGKIGETEIRKFLSAQPIFISPAYYEPFGLAVLEAAQAGCALVLSDISTLRELWDGAAVFVPPDEDNAIVEALEYLSQDSNARFRLGQLARERSKNYSVGMMAEHVLDVYRSLEPSTAVKPLTAGALA